ncbi:MAG: hypothetical protein HC929_25460, partial [Leptolyngbyaceae cyanobacterium SM2_5_2]|nr:hypothetical protein [Leptolyngbyaceae cyanobacterium SM2_5_2]
MVNLRFPRFRWLIMATLTAFMTVQISPYMALAARPSAGLAVRPQPPALAAWLSPAEHPLQPLAQPSSTGEMIVPPSRYGELVAQLQARPNRTVALPNFDPAVNGFQFSNQELIQAIDVGRNAAAWEEVLTDQLQQLFGTQVCIGQEVRT